ncbi:MAG: LL-diaminopimelate aminotransferase [Deltaproteobacteria bacterium]|nr:LL-diaminopimelate aminotransferase [Deltaproteobacteria bacterium]
MRFDRAERLKRLPPYLFAEIDRKKDEMKKKGVDIIDLGVGDPDQPTPDHIVAALKKAAEDPANQKYPSYSGMDAFNAAVARWYKARFNVDLDEKTEVITLIGSKEGIAHMPLACINPGDRALVPSPAYPVYKIGVEFAGGEPFVMDLTAKNGFLPDLDAIPGDVADRSPLMFLNYPNNPTAAVADEAFFARVVEFANEHNVLVCHDAAYTEMTYDGYRPISFLSVPGAKEVGVEFHSLSKTYNMTGWRLGFAVGNAEAIAALGQVKSNIDSGAFDAVQVAGIAALEGDQGVVEDMKALYQQRRDMLVEGLAALGFDVEKPKATFYVWMPVPGGDSRAFATKLLEEAGIVVTPGVGFGEPGEGYVRFALTVGEARLKEAIDRMGDIAF